VRKRRRNGGAFSIRKGRKSRNGEMDLIDFHGKRIDT
jgi:hypothetical protein